MAAPLCSPGFSQAPGTNARVEGQRAVLARTADLLDLAGAVEVPAEKRGLAWDEVRRRTRAARRSRHAP